MKVIPPMGGAFRNCAAPKRLQELATSAITGDRGFESGSLQQPVCLSSES